MANDSKRHQRRKPCPIAPADGRDGFDIHVGDVIKSKYGRTTRNILAVGDETVVLMGKTDIAEAISKKDIDNYWYKLNSK